MPHLERRDAVFVLHMGEDGNRFTPQLISELMRCLDEVAGAPPPRALVTAAAGKAWALGLDLEWIAHNVQRTEDLVTAMHELFARMLSLPAASVAAINGHAFAGGAMFALAHDFRVMRDDRGYFCLPEIDGALRFTPGLTGLVRARLQPQVAHAALTTGRRWGGRDALAAGIVDAAVAEERVLEDAVALAASLAGKDAPTLGAIKAELYSDVLARLRDRELNRIELSALQDAMRLAR